MGNYYLEDLENEIYENRTPMNCALDTCDREPGEYFGHELLLLEKKSIISKKIAKCERMLQNMSKRYKKFNDKLTWDVFEHTLTDRVKDYYERELDHMAVLLDRLQYRIRVLDRKYKSIILKLDLC